MFAGILGRRPRLKRYIDICASTIALIVLFPALVVIAVTIAIGFGWPILFRQSRPGLKGRTFELVKFRTMKEAFDAQGNYVRDEERLTRLGRLLRKTSLDELPEFWNVLRGEMSLVGPRPLLVEYLPLYSEKQARRHEVRPGITGLAQVRGRNALDWPKRFELDVWYVDNWTIALDLQIICHTVFKVLRREGISGKDRETMEPFRGKERESSQA